MCKALASSSISTVYLIFDQEFIQQLCIETHIAEMEQTTSRLRKTFRYPTDNDSDDSSPEALDEEGMLDPAICLFNILKLTPLSLSRARQFDSASCHSSYKIQYHLHAIPSLSSPHKHHPLPPYPLLSNYLSPQHPLHYLAPIYRLPHLLFTPRENINSSPR